jgi:hypothetical protein
MRASRMPENWALAGPVSDVTDPSPHLLVAL